MIKVQCDACFVELDKPGALLFGPPSEQDWSRKHHLCPDCYIAILEFYVKLRERNHV